MAAGRISTGVGAGVSTGFVDCVSCRFSKAPLAEASSPLVLLGELRGGGSPCPRCEIERPILLKKSPTGFAAASGAIGIIGISKTRMNFVRRAIGNHCARNRPWLKEKALVCVARSSGAANSELKISGVTQTVVADSARWRNFS